MRIKRIGPNGHSSLKITLECPYCGYIDTIQDVQMVLNIQQIPCKRCHKTNEDSGLKTTPLKDMGLD